jgi:hypothetical protein
MIIQFFLKHKYKILLFLWIVVTYISVNQIVPLDPCHFKLCYQMSKHQGRVLKTMRDPVVGTGIWLTNSYLDYAFLQFEPKIYDLIQVGDSIVKRENSLEIMVFDTLNQMKIIKLEFDACKSNL